MESINAFDNTEQISELKKKLDGKFSKPSVKKFQNMIFVIKKNVS